jgi:hypothetical protein
LEFEKEASREKAYWVLIGSNGIYPAPTLKEQINTRSNHGERPATRSSQAPGLSQSAIDSFQLLKIVASAIEDNGLLATSLIIMTLAESLIRADMQNDIVRPTAQLINTPSAEADAVPVFTEQTNTPTVTAHPIITPTSVLCHSARSSAHSAELSAHSAKSSAHSVVIPTSDLPHAKSST